VKKIAQPPIFQGDDAGYLV